MSEQETKYFQETPTKRVQLKGFKTIIMIRHKEKANIKLFP